MYTQCTLTRDNLTTVSWIPSKYARAGHTVRLRDNGLWAEWLVTATHATVDQAPDSRKCIRSHRRATGDSLPKK